MVGPTGPAPRSPQTPGNVNERLIWIESQLQQVQQPRERAQLEA